MRFATGHFAKYGEVAAQLDHLNDTLLTVRLQHLPGGTKLLRTHRPDLIPPHAQRLRANVDPALDKRSWTLHSEAGNAHTSSPSDGEGLATSWNEKKNGLSGKALDLRFIGSRFHHAAPPTTLV